MARTIDKRIPRSENLIGIFMELWDIHTPKRNTQIKPKPYETTGFSFNG
jgi:hypothetical protein